MLAAVAQSSLGTGAGYVALLLVAYDRWESPWAISLILLAEFAAVHAPRPPRSARPPTAGRGGAAWSSPTSLRAAPFVGVAVVGSFARTLVLALLAGAGTALFRPVDARGHPGPRASDELCRPRRPRTARSPTSGYTLGPALAAGLLALTSPESLLLANGVTFARVRRGPGRIGFGAQAAGRRHGEQRLAAGETRAGMRAVTRMRPIAILIGLMAGSRCSPAASST